MDLNNKQKIKEQEEEKQKETDNKIGRKILENAQKIDGFPWINKPNEMNYKEKREIESMVEFIKNHLKKFKLENDYSLVVNTSENLTMDNTFVTVYPKNTLFNKFGDPINYLTIIDPLHDSTTRLYNLLKELYNSRMSPKEKEKQRELEEFEERLKEKWKREYEEREKKEREKEQQKREYKQQKEREKTQERKRIETSIKVDKFKGAEKIDSKFKELLNTMNASEEVKKYILDKSIENGITTFKEYYEVLKGYKGYEIYGKDDYKMWNDLRYFEDNKIREILEMDTSGELEESEEVEESDSLPIEKSKEEQIRISDIEDFVKTFNTSKESKESYFELLKKEGFSLNDYLKMTEKQLVTLFGGYGHYLYSQFQR